MQEKFSPRITQKPYIGNIFSDEVFLFLFLNMYKHETANIIVHGPDLVYLQHKLSIYTCIHVYISEFIMQTVHVCYLPLQVGVTALMAASQEGHELVSDSLLKKGATVDMQTQVSCGSFVYILKGISILTHVPLLSHR